MRMNHHEQHYRQPKFICCYRWKFVLHGCIDGYSRLIVYMSCSNNNRADTVLQLFVEATLMFGCPSRVRGDRGTENTAVSDFLILQKGPGRSSFICGRSVHNQRIGRLWRDVFSGCTVLFYRLFYDMEDRGIVDANNDLHLFCLHYVFIPRINSSLGEFMSGWNNHPLRTESNYSPKQLWMTGRHPEENTVVSNINYAIQLHSA